MKKIFNVNEVAEMLNMHTRTIRRYIKEGKLEANKIGREWKIKSTAIEKLTGSTEFYNEAKSIWTENIENFIRGDESNKRNQVCSIVDLFIKPVVAKELSSKVINIMNSPNKNRKWGKMQYQYDEIKNKARFILWGNPSYVAEMLKELEVEE